MAIRRDDNKYTRLSLQQYDGQARNGEIVIDLDTYTVWVGDASGALLPVGGGNTANATIGNLTVTGTSNLGDIANITILGGSPGSVISTDGAGNLVWSPAIPTTYNDGNVEALLASGNITSNIITTGNAYLGNIITTGNSYLGSNANVNITGGNVGEVLTTDGTGNLSWAVGSTANTGNITFANTTLSTVDTLSNITLSTYDTANSITSNWVFGTDGNLTLPSNSSAINYANGAPFGGSTAAAVPAIYFTATATGNNQTFSNTYLAAYTSNTDITLFYNGALLDSDFYTLSGDTITVTTPVSIGDSINIIRTAIANANAISGYSNADANTFMAAGFVGDIIPNGNAVQSLGNITNQWKDLWVSNATIYFNTVPLSANNNTLTFAGEPLLISNGSSNINTTGTIETGGIISDGNVVANTGYFFIGDGGLLSNISGGGGSYSNANVANYLPTYTGSLDSVDTITTTGNISVGAGAFFIGDGGLLSNISTGTVYSNANVAAYMPTYTGNLGNVDNITLSGTIAGNGAGLTDITGANVTGQVANALVAGTVYTNAQPNITSVGQLTSLGVTGNITLGAGGFFIGDGGLLSNISGGNGTYGNGDVALYLPTYTGNLDNIDSITTTGNITVGTGSFIIGDGTYLTNVPGAVAEAPFTIETSSFTAVAGARYGIDTSGGAITATLPATPATGQSIFFADAGGAYATNNLTVARNGQTIMGDASDLIVNTTNQNFGLFYNGTTWRTY